MISSVKAENFLSWENLNFDVKSGVTLIDGFNRDDNTSEGSGKSAVLNSMVWGLFGKLPKDANVDDVIKTGEKSASVEVKLKSGKTIVRTRKPNALYIKDGRKKVKGKDARETQKLIEEEVGMSFDTFCQVIYLPQDFPKKFITATQEDKGKILSEIQDLQVFDRARKEVTNLLKLEKTNFTNLQMSYQEKNLKSQGALNELNLYKEQAEREKQNRLSQLAMFDNQIASKKQNITSLDAEVTQLVSENQNMVMLAPEAEEQTNSEIAKFNQVIASIKHKMGELDTHNQKLNNLKNEDTRYQNEISRITQKIAQLVVQADKVEEFLKNPESKCPTCGHDLEAPDTAPAEAQLQGIMAEVEEYRKQVVDIEQLKEAVVAQINNFQVLDLATLQNDRVAIEAEIRSRQEKLNITNQSRNQFSANNSKIESTINFIKNIVTEVKGLEDQKTAFESQPIKTYEQEINTKQSEYDNLSREAQEVLQLLNEKKAYMDRLETLKDGYKEVKSYTFNSVLVELTIKANKYLQELFEVPINIKFTNDNMKIGTAITMNGIDRGYGLLSGGQQKRVCLAVDLALSEIVSARMGTELNLRILDEYFKNLSESSMEKCLRLLEKLGGATILIEHNSIFKSIVDNVFECELVDGTTRSVA